MKWITTDEADIESTASMWLINRFIDPDAEFLHVAATEVESEAARLGAVSYAVPFPERGDIDGRAFEALVNKFGLAEDLALVRLSNMIHGLDLLNGEWVSRAGYGIRAVAHGFMYLLGVHNAARVEREAATYDALYAYCQHLGSTDLVA